MNKLWYKQPASQWEEALPIGNGSMGGMVYGGVQEDVISLNKDTLWSGKPRNPDEKKEKLNKGRAQLDTIRKHILLEEYEKARDLIEENILGDWGESFLPMADLLIETEASGTITAYRRELNLETGVSRMHCEVDGNKIEREYFCSFPAKAMIIRCCSEKKLDSLIRLKCQMKHNIHTTANEIILNGECPIHVEPDYMGEMPEAVVYGEGGIHFQTRVLIQSDDGNMEVCEDGIKICATNTFTIYILAADSFLDYQSNPCGEYRDKCKNQSKDLKVLSYEKHLKTHREDYQALYQRMDFILDENSENKYEEVPTDERLIQFAQEEKDIGLFPLMVQYGRYLMIAASREGSQPMNLQGIWNKNIRAVWSSNYTVNINTQMNYWPVFPCNLGNLNEPLVSLIQDISESGKYTARELYGCKGWVSHHNIDLWRLTTPVGGPWKGNGFSAVRHSMWPMSGVWLCHHLFEQYEYALDCEYLRHTAFPIMEGSALFLLDWLMEMPNGSLGTVPSTSPENEFIWKDKEYGATYSSVMDISLIRELFQNCIKSMEILGINNEFYAKLRDAINKLQTPIQGTDGSLLEWAREYEENEIQHRHVSHLYGLYPGDIMPEELRDACKCSLNKRGDEGTGWSLAWKSCLWARLGDSKRVYKLLKRQLQLVDKKSVEYVNGGIYKNLFMAHPPFQIDANFGITAAILETLIQCKNGAIYLLEALPEDWKGGRIRGVLAKGGILVEIAWENGDLNYVKIKATKETKEVLLYYRERKLMEICNEDEEMTFGINCFK